MRDVNKFKEIFHIIWLFIKELIKKIPKTIVYVFKNVGNSKGAVYRIFLSVLNISGSFMTLAFIVWLLSVTIDSGWTLVSLFFYLLSYILTLYFFAFVIVISIDLPTTLSNYLVDKISNYRAKKMLKNFPNWARSRNFGNINVFLRYLSNKRNMNDLFVSSDSKESIAEWANEEFKEATKATDKTGKPDGLKNKLINKLKKFKQELADENKNSKRIINWLKKFEQELVGKNNNSKKNISRFDFYNFEIKYEIFSKINMDYFKTLPVEELKEYLVFLKLKPERNFLAIFLSNFLGQTILFMIGVAKIYFSKLDLEKLENIWSFDYISSLISNFFNIDDLIANVKDFFLFDKLDIYGQIYLIVLLIVIVVMFVIFWIVLFKNYSLDKKARRYLIPVIEHAIEFNHFEKNQIATKLENFELEQRTSR